MKQHVTRNISTTRRVALAVTLSLASAIALTIGINQLVTVLKPHQKYLLFGLAASATTLTGSLLLAAASAIQVQEFLYEKNLNSFRQEIERNWQADNVEPTCPQSNPQGKSEEAQSPQEAVIESLPNEKRYKWLTTQQLNAHWKRGDFVAPNSAIDKFDADLN